MATNRPDMPQFLAALDETVVLLNQLQRDTPSHDQVEDALTTHMNMLAMFRDIQYQTMSFIRQTRVEGQALTKVMEDLSGPDSFLTHRAKELTESCPPLTEEYVATIEALAQQIQKLQSLRHELWLEDKIDKVVSREVEILRELPRLFPEGASTRKSLEKRTKPLK